MDGNSARRPHPELKQIVAQASRALALLDVDRLEELARACASLNRIQQDADAFPTPYLVRQAREAAGEMATFARVLEATRANLNVMNRLRDLRRGHIEYCGHSGRPFRLTSTEGNHGDD